MLIDITNYCVYGRRKNISVRTTPACHRPHSQTKDHKMTDFDSYLWGESKHYRSYKKLGAHLCQIDGAQGVHFGVWAPNASKVTVMGDFNGWNRESHSLQHFESGYRHLDRFRGRFVRGGGLQVLRFEPQRWLWRALRPLWFLVRSSSE